MKITLITLLIATLPPAIIIYVGHDLILNPLFTNIINLPEIMMEGIK